MGLATLSHLLRCERAPWTSPPHDPVRTGLLELRPWSVPKVPRQAASMPAIVEHVPPNSIREPSWMMIISGTQPTVKSHTWNMKQLIADPGISCQCLVTHAHYQVDRWPEISTIFGEMIQRLPRAVRRAGLDGCRPDYAEIHSELET